MSSNGVIFGRILDANDKYYFGDDSFILIYDQDGYGNIIDCNTSVILKNGGRSVGNIFNVIDGNFYYEIKVINAVDVNDSFIGWTIAGNEKQWVYKIILLY